MIEFEHGSAANRGGSKTHFYLRGPFTPQGVTPKAFSSSGSLENTPQGTSPPPRSAQRGPDQGRYTQEQALHFAGSLRKWLIKINDGRPVPDGAITVQKIDNAEGLKKYLAKGTEPHFSRFCRIRPQDIGAVHGRKSGVSRNLGTAECIPRKAAWKAARRRAA